MKHFKQLFLEAVFQKLGGFETSLSTNKELKAAHDLCKKIEDLNPGSEALIVGGAVRDLVIGKQPHDIDIATNVDINILIEQFKSYNIGKSKTFGIVVIPFEGYSFEVAHYREDIGSTDHRRPDEVKLVKSFEKDSARRDFTINSLGLNTKGEIVDYQNGLEDIKNKLIKAVGNPHQRFEEDFLRILRAIRLIIKCGFKIEEKTEKSLIELRYNIKKVSAERIKEELFKVASMGGLQLANYIQYLDKVGLLEIILPEIKNLQTVEHNPKHHPEGAWVEKI